ncbi:MAG: alpha/beta hydrolase [Clostridia bacterium]|nr:alpha/beta hydrolase [Clostridia bacterium]
MLIPKADAQKGGGYLLILVIILMIALVALFAQLGNTYYTKVQVIRKLFRIKGEASEGSKQKVSVLYDIEYQSVLPHGLMDIYTPNETEDVLPVVVWVHGGGYVGGDKSFAEPWAYTIAAHKKATVVSINYCRAPEQHYPGPLLQLNEALRFLADNAQRFRLDVSRLFLAGDSAGAQIASQYAALVCNKNLQNSMNIRPAIAREQLKGLLLCCGFYNMDTVLKARFPAMKTFLWAYTDTKNIHKFARKNEMSTVKNIDDTFCDVFLTCGDADPFLGQAKEMAAALSAANVTADVYLPRTDGKKLGHEYQFALNEQEAQISLIRAMDFIEERV